MPTCGTDTLFGLDLKIKQVENGYIVFIGEDPEYVAKTETELKNIVSKLLAKALKEHKGL